MNYVKYLLVLALIFLGCVLISVFVSLVCVPVGITSSALGLKISATTVGIKKVKVNYQEQEELAWRNSVARKR